MLNYKRQSAHISGIQLGWNLLLHGAQQVDYD